MTTTQDLQAALDDINAIDGRTFSNVDECDTIYAGKLVRYMDEIRTALSLAIKHQATVAAIEAETHVVVPVEPTDKMFFDPDEACSDFHETPWGGFVRIYKRLLAAAPEIGGA